MARPVRAEGVVLRSLRFGEADRIIHIYTLEHGRLGAIVKGARKVNSRLGGRVEPFLRCRFMLQVGRGQLATVTGAETVDAQAALRESLRGLAAASIGSDAALRMLATGEPSVPAYNLLCRYLGLLSDDAAEEAEARAPARWVALAQAFRLKLLVATGFGPGLGACASCGSPEHLGSFSPAAGGAVCGACATGSVGALRTFPLSGQALAFMRSTVGEPMAQVRSAPHGVLAQVDRAVVETAAFHANVRLRPASLDGVIGRRSRVRRANGAWPYNRSIRASQRPAFRKLMG